MSAAAPSTEVEICNLALARIGQGPVNSIDSPSTWIEELMALHYPVVRRDVLRGPLVFNFSKKYAQLTVDATVVPAFGFGSALRLPNDWLRLLSLGDITIGDDTPPGLYDIVGQHVYTDEVDDEDTVNIYYVRDVTTVGLWDAKFVNLIRLELAKVIAFRFTLKQAVIDGIDNELRDVKLAAGAVAGQEKPPVRVERSRYRDVRRNGGRADPTRYP